MSSAKRQEATWRAIKHRPAERELNRQIGLTKLKLKQQARAKKLESQLEALQARA